MLDEQEWERMASALSDFEQKVKPIKHPAACDHAEAQRLVGELEREVSDRYFEITGYRETNIHAIRHHRLADFGPECSRCGHLFRTPQAGFCANCGLKKNLTTDSADGHG